MQKKRREFVRSTAALAAAASLGPVGPAFAQQKVVWKASDVHPTGYPTVEAIELAASDGARHVVMGMAHRGRLNVLAHIIGRSYETILREFELELEAA